MNDRPDPASSKHSTEIRGLMRWWRGIGLGFMLLALLLFSRDQDALGYGALAVGWAVLIYAIIARTGQSRAKMRGGSVERD